MAGDWNEALERFDGQTMKRRERAKEHDEQAQQVIREAEERHRSDDHPPPGEKGSG
jgi:hypothetical protein